MTCPNKECVKFLRLIFTEKNVKKIVTNQTEDTLGYNSMLLHLRSRGIHFKVGITLTLANKKIFRLCSHIVAAFCCSTSTVFTLQELINKIIYIKIKWNYTQKSHGKTDWFSAIGASVTYTRLLGLSLKLKKCSPLLSE